MARLLYIVPETDMRGRQAYLWEHAKSYGVKRENVKEGDVVAFLNTREDRLALLGVTGEKDSIGVVAFYQAPHGRVEKRAIKYVAQSFGATGRFDMNAEVEKVLNGLGLKKERKSE